MTSIKLFFILQKHVAVMNNLAMKLKMDQIDKETTIAESIKSTKELESKIT